jgi:Ca2+-binding RTX toxin-like protein
MRRTIRAPLAALAATLIATLALVGAATQSADAAPACTITGNNASNELNGTPGRDVICGLGGDDTLRGLGGADVIRGGGGDDIVYGGPGADRVFGDHGEDIVHTKDGVSGNDLADGGQTRGDSCRTDQADERVRCP